MLRLINNVPKYREIKFAVTFVIADIFLYICTCNV